jgi:L-asparaginase II
MTSSATAAPQVPRKNPDNPVLAEVVRSGFTESRHRGAIAVVGPDGAILHQAGAVDVPIFPRSSNKPMQATAMLGCGPARAPTGCT